METIQAVLDAKLLKAANRAAKRQNTNRSALFREALRCHLKRLEILELEARDRAGYVRHGASPEEVAAWEDEAAWPAD
jgi:metal-responsive CopG/Arc/MetJ family transcriptional regulator